MADMFDSGIHWFEAWARQTPSPAHATCWYNLWLGEFNPYMTAEEASSRLEHHKLTKNGRDMFKRGWERAQAVYLSKIKP